MSIGRIVRQRVRISGERLSHLAPCHAEAASCKIGEFVEPLRAEDSAALEQLLRLRRARIGGESVDEDIAVEEFARHRPYRVLASWRSNLHSGGSFLRNAEDARAHARGFCRARCRTPGRP